MGNMARLLVSSGALLLLLAGWAEAGDAVNCKGSISSKQGEGLVVKTFRFDVEVTGSDMQDMLEKCKNIARQKQNKAGRANPAVKFRKFSDLDLDCIRGAERFQVRRGLQTSP